MTTLQQGENLQYTGRLLRRAKGSTDYEVVEDLTPYRIELRLFRGTDKAPTAIFKVYKGEGLFYTDQLSTSGINTSTSYKLYAALVIEEGVVVANNYVPLTIERSPIGQSLAMSEGVDYGEESITEGSIESGEWEYQIEIAQSGSDAAINGWSDTSEAVALALGVVLKGDTGKKGDTGDTGAKGDKGDAFTYDDYTAEQITILQQPATDAAKEVLAVNLWEQCNTSQSYVSTTNVTSKVISTTEDHRSMIHDIEVGEATHVTWQLWNPNLIDNTVEEVEIRISNRFTFYNEENTKVVGYEDLPSLDGSSYQTGVIEVPDGAYWARLGFIMGYSGDDEQTLDADIYAMVEVGEVAHSYRQSKADLKVDLKGDKGDQGDAFTYNDFTEEQIALLQKPATDAVAEIEETMDQIVQYYEVEDILDDILGERIEGKVMDKANAILAHKADIKTAIEYKGSPVGDAPLADYPEKINEIITGQKSEQLEVSVTGLADGDLSTITVAWSDGFDTGYFTGDTLIFTVPTNEYYKVTASHNAGYITPLSQSYKAVSDNIRQIEMEYTATVAATIYFDNSIASPANISGDINAEAIASILSKVGRCMAMNNPDGGVKFTMLDADNSNLYADGTPAATDGTEGDVMVYTPEFWIKNEYVDSDTSRLIFSETEIDGGKHMPARLIGAYKGYVSDFNYYSVSGVLPTSSVSQETFRLYAQARGTGWDIIDYDDHRLIAALFYAKYGTRNSQAILGTGNLNNGSGLTGHTNYRGNADTTGNTANEANNFLGIEAVSGWYYELCKGVDVSGYVWTITRLDGTVEEIDTLQVGTSGYITKMLFENGGAFDLIPIATGGSDSTYYCDYLTASASASRVLARSGYGTGATGGVSFTSTYGDSSSASTYIGSRLAFHGTITMLEPDEYKSL